MTNTSRTEVGSRMAETAEAVKKAVNNRVGRAKRVMSDRVIDARKTAASAIKKAEALMRRASNKVAPEERNAAKATPRRKAANAKAPGRKAAKGGKAKKATQRARANATRPSARR